jgi:UDP:flavonoid glycosyltransferase YjiC (YdhE family)
MKILFLSEAVSLAHIGRPLVLAKWAQNANFEVHFAASEEGLKSTNAKTLGFKTYPLFTIKSSLFYERVNKGKFFYSFKELIKYVEEEKELIRQINPDLIVTDFRLSAPISSWLCNKPLLNLSNSHWSPNSECPFPAPNAGIFNWLPKSLGEKIFSMIRPLAFKLFGKELNKTRSHYGLPEKSDFRELYTDGTFNAYLDMPNFTTLEKLPKNHFFLGPVIWNPDTNSQPLDLKDTNNIYISMGSTGNNKLIDPIINSALKTSAFIIISGVSTEEESKLYNKHPTLKDRSLIKKLVDPVSILPKCCLTICHGGSGTVYQSLSHGIPVLCFPTNPDQYLVSYSVENKKLGKFISEASPTKSKIETAILDIFKNKTISINAQKYSLEIREQNTFKNWINFLNNLFPKQIPQETIIFKANPMKKYYRPSGVSIAFNQTLKSLDSKEEIKSNSPSGYTIKLANNLEERESAYRLAYKVYLDKGYIKENPFEWLVKSHDANPDTATLIVQDKNKNVVGSVTMIFDGTDSLPAKSIYYKEIQTLKSRNEKIVEISRLVIDQDHRNAKEILTILFNYLYIFSRHVKKYTCLTIEVNPRHKEFYRSMLGFEVIGSEKPCPNVQDAPAILLYSSLNPKNNIAFNKIHLSLESKTRSLAQNFLKPEQEGLVAAYLKKQHKPMTEEEKIYFGFTDSTIGKTLCV